MTIPQVRIPVIALTAAAVLLVFALDFLRAHGIATWLLYVVPVLLASQLTGPKGIAILAGVLTALIWLGMFLSPPDAPVTTEVINASLAILTLWATSYFLIQRFHAERRVEAERAELLRRLADAQSRWEATLEGMLDPVTMCDGEGRATYMNGAYARMIGRRIESGLSLDAHPIHYQLYRPDGSLFTPKELPLQRAALLGQEVRGVEVVQRASDGAAHVVLWNAAPLRDTRGLLIGAVASGREITAQRHAEAALRRSEEAYRTLAESAPDAIDRFDRTFVRIYTNQKSARLYGTSVDALVGTRIDDTGVPEVYTRRWKESIQQVFTTGEPCEMEEELATHQGVRVFHSRFAPEGAADGSVASVVVFSHDVTDRKRVETERERFLTQVAQERNRLQTLIESISDEVWLCDAEGNLSLLNSAAAAGLGLEQRDAQRWTLPELISQLEIYTGDGRLRPRDEAPLLRALRGETLREEEEVVRHRRTGALRHRLVSAAPLKSPAREVLGAVAVVHDITERKRIEEHLRESEERLRLALRAAGAGTWDWDLRTNDTTWSDAYYGIVGLSPGATPASYEAWLKSVHPEDREGVLRTVRHSIEGHRDLDLEFRVVRPDGGVRWLNERGKTFYDEEARPLRMLGISTDITEHKRAEEALRRAHDALKQQLDARTQALSGIGERLHVDASRVTVETESLGALSEQLNRRVGELLTLDKVSRELVASLEPDQVLGVLVNEVRGLLRADGASVLLYDPAEDTLTFAAVSGLGADALRGERMPARGSLGGWVIRERRPVNVADPRNHPLVTDSPNILLDGAVRTILVVPLLSKGVAIGVLGAVNKLGGVFSAADVQSLTAVATVAAVAIENARLFKAERARRSQLEAVRAVATEIARELDLPALLHLIARRAGNLLGVATGTVWLWDGDANVLVPGASLGHDWWTTDRRLRLGEGVAGTVAQQRTGLVVNDYATSPYALPIVLSHPEITAVLAAPLLFRDRLVGVLAMDNAGTGRTFTPEDQEILSLFATHAAIAIGNARLYQDLRFHRDRLRTLTAETLRSREEEATRIARELHDEIGQSLTCILLGLQGIEKLASLADMRAKLTELGALVAKPLVDVQRLVRALRPIMLDELGLIPALERYVKGYAAATGVHVEFFAHGVESTRFPSAVETTLYRTLQEALTNVAKHAKARHVSVLVKRRGRVVSLVVEDDGQGFDVAAVKARQGEPSGVGLLGMEERAHLLSGTVAIESTQGKGTTIVMEVPFEEPEVAHGAH